MSRRSRPYPVEPLAQALGIDPGDTATLATAVGVDRSWIKRYRRWGLSEAQADEWAVRAGLHPAQVWPTWTRLDLSGAALTNANRITCPQGHAYDRRNTRGDRVCTTCTKKHASSQVAALTGRRAPPVPDSAHMARHATPRVRVVAAVPADVAAAVDHAAADAGLTRSAWACMALTAATRGHRDPTSPPIDRPDDRRPVDRPDRSG